MQVEALAARRGVSLDSPCSDAPVRRPDRLRVSRLASARTALAALLAPEGPGDHGGAARLDPHGGAELRVAATYRESGLTPTTVDNHPKSTRGGALPSDLLISFAVAASRHGIPSRMNGNASLGTCAALRLPGTSERWTCCVGECGGDNNEPSPVAPSLALTPGATA